MKKVSEKSLNNAALYYLKRYASSKANLVKVLQRKVLKLSMTGVEVSDEAGAWINTVADKCVDIGLVDDASFALTKGRSMARQGRSMRRIRETLFQKGVGEADIDNALSELEHHEGKNDWIAAGIHAKKKRLGPYRPNPLPEDWEDNQKQMNKEIGNFSRAGFSMEIILKIVKAETILDVENLISEYKVSFSNLLKI